MALQPGSRVGPYEVIAPIGAGGMGEVYRARDTKLNRDVALKVLPDAFASDPERLARFRREAQLLASLNHPNIAAIHGLEESDGTRALVLEFVDGPTLADRIAHGPIPLDEALQIARQIATAVEAAHASGVIHRDLKPANVKVRPDDTVKVLDFGLARAIEGASRDGSQPSAELTHSPTITSPAMTAQNVILGTAAYMSPEQARGKTVDKRADVWAFGCIVYEMLTGRRLFDASEVTDTLAFVLTKEPDWKVLPAATPASIHRLLHRCLEKDRARRLADIADARLEIEEAIAPQAVPQNVVVSATAPRFTRAIGWSATAIAAAVALAALVVLKPWAAEEVAAPAAIVRLNADIGASVSLAMGAGGSIALSPDGSTVAFAAARPPLGASTVLATLYVRRLDQLDAIPLAGSEGAYGPFFSPDSRWVGFFAANKMKKVAVTGGPVVTICDVVGARGASWGASGTIVFQPGNPAGSVQMLAVSANGGKPEPITSEAYTGSADRWPQILPGGTHVLYTSTSISIAGFNDANLMVRPLGSGEAKILHRGGYFGRYLPSGHLTFFHDGTVFAAPFNLAALEMTGPAVPVIENVASDVTQGVAEFDVSNNGTLMYAPGSERGATVSAPIAWMDRTGTTRPLRATPSSWGTPRIAPDGRRLALTLTERGQTDIWTYTWDNDNLTRLTFDDAIDAVAVWTADSRRIAFGSQRAGGGFFNLYWQRADGTGEVQRLTESPESQLPGSWHPSGKFLAFHQGIGLGNKQDIFILPMEGDEATGWKPGKPTEFIGGPFRKVLPMFSPDGRWIAYVSNEAGGPFEVFVRPFPGPGGKWQISSGGGNDPRWSRTRPELFFRSGSGTTAQITVVPYAVNGESFQAEKPRAWSEKRFSIITPINAYGGAYDLAPDGERFALMPVPDVPQVTPPAKFVFVFNFLDELRRLAAPPK